jgi:predicted lipoprotein
MEKSHYRFIFLSVTMVLLLGTGSCKKDESADISGSDEQKTKVITQYIEGVVVETYRSLADASMELYLLCEALRNNPDQANINAACEGWISARKYWEQSEAFLFGAAADYNIDPHIDSWPLDKTQLDQALKNTSLIENMAVYGCNFTGFSTLGYGLLGFHAIEYMIFRDGAARNIAGGTDSDGAAYGVLSRPELIYCLAVAEDLRNQCIRLEASWTGIENISAEKQAILNETELQPSMDYGSAMKTAGEQGNVLYKSQLAAYVQILQGAADISDEVGNTKINDPVNSGNVLDVESWYSWNSITDFADNIRSVRHVYLGGTSENGSNLSVSSYVSSLDEKLDSEIRTAIVNAINSIESMPAPFRNHLTVSETAAAKSACHVLFNKLEEAIELLQK